MPCRTGTFAYLHTQKARVSRKIEASAWEHSRWDSSAAALLPGTNRQGGFARTDTTRGHLSTCLSPGVSQTVTTHRVKRRERRLVGPARLRSSTSQSFSACADLGGEHDRPLFACRATEP